MFYKTVTIAVESDVYVLKRDPSYCSEECEYFNYEKESCAMFGELDSINEYDEIFYKRAPACIKNQVKNKVRRSR